MIMYIFIFIFLIFNTICIIYADVKTDTFILIDIIFNLFVYIISLAILKRIIKTYKKQLQVIILLYAVITTIAFILILYRKVYNDIGSISCCVGILSSYLTLCIKKNNEDY